MKVQPQWVIIFLRENTQAFFSEDKNIDIVPKKSLVAFSLFPKLRTIGRNNSQHCCANTVGSCCVRVGSGVQTDYSNLDDHTEPIYELTTMLGPAVHRGMGRMQHFVNLNSTAILRSWP